MQRWKVLSVCAVLAAATSVANAAVTFSNVMIHGSLSGGATSSSGSNAINFEFPNANVGDPPLAQRVGNIVITFEATAPEGIAQNVLNILGALRGSGTVFFNEVVEDLVNPGVIASYNTVLDMNNQLPASATLNFSRSTTHLKVKKTLVLSAVDTSAADLANVSLVQQLLTPEPATGLLFVLALPLIRRRF